MIRHALASNPSEQFCRHVVMADVTPVGTEFQSWIADGKYECRYVSVLEWETWRTWYLCPLELQYQGSGKPAAWFMSARPFMMLYILQTLSDIPLDGRFSSCS